MKKFYMLSAIALCAYVLVSMPSVVSAQLKGDLPSPGAGNVLAHNYRLNHPVNNSRALTGMWLDYWFVADSLAEENYYSPQPYYSYIFPDSSIQICDPASSDTCFNPYVHLIGTVLDPNSGDMQRILNYSWSNSNPYYVDSIALYYNYVRNTAPNIVDTLFTYFWDSDVSTDLPIYYYTGGNTLSEFGTDTVRVAEMLYDSTGTNAPIASPGAITKDTILLTYTDTATIDENLGVELVNLNHKLIAAGNIVASAFKFVPGYSYSPGDKISTTGNVFSFLSDESNGPNSYASYTPGDYNCSETVTNEVRYNLPGSYYHGKFVPTYAFTSAWPFQQHRIDYYIEGTFDAGINESISESGLKLYQNQPNPANQTSVIRYQTISSNPVTFEVRDVTGRLVMEMSEGIQSVGAHSLTIDVSKLSQGLYIYTLRTNNESLSRRMIVSE